jgi:hypothetical protein
LRVEFPPNLEYAGIRSKSVPVDWSSFREVRFDLFHPGSEPLDLEVRLRDYSGRIFARQVRVSPGPATVTVPLDDLAAEIDARRVRSFAVLVTGPRPGSDVLYFDRLMVRRDRT